jgi:6-phosphogluconolactonase
MSRLLRFPDAAEAAQACGRQTLEWLDGAIAEQGQATLAVSGGSSPRPMFEMFARTKFPWDQVHLFWVDERAVPPTDPQSNFKLADDVWLGPAQFPRSNVHRIEAELGAQAAAERYTAALRKFFKLASGEMPRFDAIHRGMGPDAHTASLFPAEPLIEDRSGLAAAVWVEKLKQWRITLLPGVLEAARHTAMLVTGADKAQPLAAVLSAPYDPMQHPAQIATRKPDPAVWFVDAAAAAAAETAS